MEKEIYRLMLSYGFKPNHKLDQNFIVDKSVLTKIIETIKPNKEEIILEIGAGLGFLTKELLSNFKKVIAIEKDKKLCEILEKEYSSQKEKLEIINSDVLDVDFSKLKFHKIVGLIPYSISLKIIEKIIGIKPTCFVVQKEFAEKLIAFEGFTNYVAISVVVQSYSEINIIKNIKKKSFFPKPKVDSAMVYIVPNEKKINKEYLGFIKELFRYAKKDITNGLYHINKENVKKYKIEKVPMDLQKKKIRQLSVMELERIFESVK